jgi:sugar phosphate isomerase/epimerase
VEKPPFRIGNQTSKEVPSSLPYEFALRHGFDAFEWFSDKGQAGWSEDDMDAAARRRLRQAAEYAGLLFSVHAPYWADPVTPEGASAIRKSVAFGGDVGAGVVNLHLFPRHAPERFAEALAPLLDAAASAGVRLSLENTPECSPEDFNAAFTALAALPAARGASACAWTWGTPTCTPARATTTSASWIASGRMSPSSTGTPTRTGATVTAT